MTQITHSLLMAPRLRDSAYEACESSQMTPVILQLNLQAKPYAPLDEHPDVFALELPKATVMAPSLWSFLNHSELPPSREWTRGQEDPKEAYPNTARYNGIVFDRYLIGNESCLDPQVIIMAKKSGIDFVKTNQGYSRCSSFVIGKNTIVTSDLGIAKEMRRLSQNNFEVIFVAPQTIKLKGFSHGFIGGTTWALGPSKRYFYGDPTQLTEWGQVKSALQREGVEAIFDKAYPLEDVGSAIIL